MSAHGDDFAAFSTGTDFRELTTIKLQLLDSPAPSPGSPPEAFTGAKLGGLRLCTFTCTKPFAAASHLRHCFDCSMRLLPSLSPHGAALRSCWQHRLGAAWSVLQPAAYSPPSCEYCISCFIASCPLCIMCVGGCLLQMVAATRPSFSHARVELNRSVPQDPDVNKVGEQQVQPPPFAFTVYGNATGAGRLVVRSAAQTVLNAPLLLRPGLLWLANRSCRRL